ncbi:MAG: Ig-like domain-containing protein [Clostridia bacterium]|nr:Ig-like domain-containing protein [Clostridia bacterium]
MKKRIIALVMCALVAVSAVPVMPVADLFSVEATAVNIEALEQAYNSAPKEESWGDYINGSSLKYVYKRASDIIANPSGYSQEDIDECAADLEAAVNALQPYATGISLNKTALVLEVGKSETLLPVLAPAKAGGNVSWTSSDSEHVAVSANGTVSVLGYTSSAVEIKASVSGKDGTVYNSSCFVKTENPLAGVALSSKNLVLYTGAQKKLNASLEGLDKSARPTSTVFYTWDSSNVSVATVDDQGYIVAVGEGSCTITLKVRDSAGRQFTDTCAVTVNKLTPVTSLNLTGSNKIIMTSGSSVDVKVIVIPDSASIKALKWATSARDVVAVSDFTVSDSGMASAKLTAGKEGTAKITYATTDGSEIRGTIEVEVRPLISELKLSAASKSITVDSQGEKIGVTILPANAGNQKLTWFSTDESVCKVDYDGVLYPVSTGECNIKISTTDGSDIVATCRVVVSAKAREVKISRSAAEVENGDAITLYATVTTTDGGTHDAVIWSTSDENIATVDQNGVVRAKYPGQVAIKALAADGTNLYDICTVTVTQKITGITLPESEKIAIGTTKVLTPAIEPSYATEKKLIWTSNNPAVATVSSEGVVTAVNVGSAIITCKNGNGNAAATCKVEVVVPATGITLSSASEELWMGEVVLLNATVYPNNATDKTVTWTTSNEAVATVSADGLVTAVAGGSCLITARNSAGNTASCRIEVFESCTGVEISATVKGMYIGQKDRLTANVLPATATNKQVNWSSSNPLVASVDSLTGEITALRTGSVVITATTADGGFTASCTLTVHGKVNVTGVAFDRNEKTVTVGVIEQLVVYVSPNNASEQSVTWHCSDTSVLLVDQKGRIKGVKAGTAVVTAKTVDGGFTAQMKIYVKQPVTGIRITTTDVKLAVGKSKALSWNIFPDNATNQSINWTSSDTSVATVDQNGVVTAKKAGLTVITATTVDGGFTSTCNFTIYVPVTGVEVSATTIAVPKGGTRLLSAIVKPSNATNKAVSWVSSNTSIATVNEAGQVTGVAKGSVTVTCKTADGAFKASCTVNVIQYVEKITLDATSVSLQAGKSKTLTAKVSPSTATFTKVNWSSSNTKVATVDANGVVKALAGGSAVITAKSLDGNATATCKINVTQPATGVTVTSPYNFVRIGKIMALKATVVPATATNKKLTWTSSDTKRATVNADGVVTGISQGYVNITAKTANGFTATCKILVVKSVTGIKLDKTSITMNVGKATTITPTISPADATVKTVNWSSDNNDVATVDSTGKVTAKGQGHATITARTTDGAFTATSSVLVIKPVTSVTLNKTSAYLNLGASMSLVPKIVPSDATIQSVTWTSSDPSVATVSSTGLVKGLKKGTTIITCRTNNGGKTATCTISVVKRVTGITLNKSDEILYLGKTLSLVSTVYPVDASVKTVTYHSSNNSIATVNANGIVTPLNIGTVNITAVTNDGSYKATCKVTVKKAPESIRLGTYAATIKVGQTPTLAYSVYPADATNRIATFTSSNPEVATVDAAGRITAISRGTANITAETENGIKAVCKITVTQPVKGIEIDPTAEVYTGEKITPYVSVLPKDANNQKVTWKTSDSSIAKVSSSGEVTGIKAGKVIITAVSAENANFTASCEVTVKQHVTSVSFNEKEVYINKGAEADLAYTVFPADATDKGVTFESSDTSVLAVTNDGHMTAKLGGKAVITVISNDGSFKATCYVNVVEPASGVSLNYSEKEMFVTDTLQLVATVSPSDAYNKLVRWSSDSAIASVDSDGVVTALKSGTATITATTVDGNYTAECKLTLLQRATAIVTDKPEVKINRGTTCQLNAEVLPEDCYNKAFKWTSADENIATVTDDGLVEGIAPGVVTLTCTSLESGIFVTVQLTVHEPVTDFDIIEAEEVLYTPLTKKLSTEILPLNASDKSITWETSDESIATVSEDGTVTAVGKGEVTITATSVDSGLKDSCTFTIFTGVEEIITDKDAYSFHENTTMKLDYSFNPDAVDDPRVKFESSNEDVFTVSEDGTLTGIVLGQAELIITSLQNEKVSKTVAINITRAVTDISLDITEKVIFAGDEIKLTETVLPVDASDKSVIWLSSDERVATVDENGIVTAVARGFATITATTVDGELSAECAIEVVQLPEEVVSSKDKYVVFMGQPLTLDFEVLPEDTNDKILEWSSSDEEIAIVDAEGTVTPVSTGRCEITAKSVKDGVERTVEVTVVQLSEEVKFFCRVEELEIGGRVRVFATVLPETTTDKSFLWSSSDESIATVDEYGVITAVSSGTVQIIATCLDEGGASGVINVTVK